MPGTRLLFVYPQYKAETGSFFADICSNRRFRPRFIFMKPPVPGEEWSDDRWPVEVIGVDHIRVQDYSLRQFLKLTWHVFWETVRSDAVFTSTQNPLHSKVAFFLSRMCFKRIGIRVEQWNVKKERSLALRGYHRLSAFMLRHADLVFVHGRAQKRFVLSQGVDPAKVRVLPFLSEDLAAQPVREDVRKALGLSRCKTILYFNRVTPQKGLMDLLKAYEVICQKMDEVALLVCGGPDSMESSLREDNLGYLEQCSDFVKKRQLKRVFFLGRIGDPDKAVYFSAADVYVHPHARYKDLDEGWGLTLNEAASLSLPIVTTDRVGAAWDLVREGENGFVVPSGNIDSLIEKLLLVLGDDGLRRRMGTASRRIFDDYHKPESTSRIIGELLGS